VTFSSLIFLCVFMPVVFIIYRIVPSLKVKNIILIIASLLFYAYGEPVYILLMLFSTVLNYALTLWFSTKEGTFRKVLMIITCIVDLSVLGVFKYTDMILSTINSVFSLEIPLPNIALPIGISFFTFQAMSYSIDVYRKVVKAEKNYFNILLYISFFPQLIAGPIVKYSDIDREIKDRSANSQDIAEGLKRFIRGLSKKVLISNTLGMVADGIYAFDVSIGTLTAWMAAISYMLQIYYDFSGYSDMAIGLGRIFGFHFKENFDHPYSADSIQVFWRKWHISLSTWFKEYLYIPLGGNRKGKMRTWINKLIVFFCTGLWHGANWTFVVWGLYHGFFLILETIFPKFGQNRKIRPLRHIYVVLVVMIGFVFFRADNMSQAFLVIGAMFTPVFSEGALVLFMSYLSPLYIFVLILAVIFSMPISDRINNFLEDKDIRFEYLNYGFSMALLILCILSLASNTYNPFIYFRF